VKVISKELDEVSIFDVGSKSKADDKDPYIIKRGKCFALPPFVNSPMTEGFLLLLSC